MKSHVPDEGPRDVTSPPDVTPEIPMLKDLNQALSRIHSYEEIRLFIAGTPNFGHQASSVDLLLRLSWDYAYPGLITVVYDRGNQKNGWTVPKLVQLLQRHINPAAPERLPQQLHVTRVQWLSTEEFAARTSKLVDFGLTGGAEIGRVYHSSLADMLNVRTALKAQPFQWPWCRDGIDFCTQSNQSSVDLLSEDYLGWRLFHRAYRLPGILQHPLKSDRQGKNDAVVQQLLTSKAENSAMLLSCVYGVRRDGVCRIDLANLLYVYFLALLRAFSVHTTHHRRILVVTLDEFCNDAFARLQAYICGQEPCPTFAQASLSSSGNLSTWIRCIHAPEDLPTAITWFESSDRDFHVKILYVHIGPSQVFRIPDDTYRHGDVIDRIQAASLDLQRGALGEMDIKRSIECVSHLVFECTDPASPLSTYLDDLKSYYRQRGADKFETLLSAWNKYGVFKKAEAMKGGCVNINPADSVKSKLHIEEARELLFQLGLN
ncbi:hypothetical protein CNMCM8694_002612 [Aspergillus lentulus]|nr:hypothetical protein CNMCM8060_002833 [Aspergillus lentulus]KAF4190982.1 hypothetical protein CNMCM8694_002612 [Aspergillus lentulus]